MDMDVQQRNREQASRSAKKDLRFDWSPHVRREAHREMAASYAPGQPRLAAQLREAFAQRDFVADFERRFSVLGLEANHLGDVTAAHWLSMWTVVHDAAFPSAAQVQRVREQLADSWPRVAGIDDPRQRQLLSETMITELVLALDELEARRSAGDRKGLELVSTRTAQAMRQKRGINLRALAITDRGISAAGLGDA